jgi:hypothetical protein
MYIISNESVEISEGQVSIYRVGNTNNNEAKVVVDFGGQKELLSKGESSNFVSSKEERVPYKLSVKQYENTEGDTTLHTYCNIEINQSTNNVRIESVKDGKKISSRKGVYNLWSNCDIRIGSFKMNLRDLEPLPDNKPSIETI